VRVAGRSHDLSAGTVLLLGQGLSHGFAQHPADDVVVLHFSCDASALAATDAWRKFLPFMRSARRGLLLHPAERNRELLKALSRLSPSGDLRGLLSFIEVAHQLCQQAWHPLFTSSVIADPLLSAPGWLHSLCPRIDARLREPLNLTLLCQLGGIGRSALCSGFQRYYACGPMTWVLRRRLLLAAEMLVAGDRRMIDVAFACGFNSLSTFTRRFTEMHGEPPAHWREGRIGVRSNRTLHRSSAVRR
jgi:AraC-like DNA-binding protein